MHKAHRSHCPDGVWASEGLSACHTDRPLSVGHNVGDTAPGAGIKSARARVMQKVDEQKKSPNQPMQAWSTSIQCKGQ